MIERGNDHGGKGGTIREPGSLGGEREVSAGESANGPRDEKSYSKDIVRDAVEKTALSVGIALEKMLEFAKEAGEALDKNRSDTDRGEIKFSALGKASTILGGISDVAKYSMSDDSSSESPDLQLIFDLFERTLQLVEAAVPLGTLGQLVEIQRQEIERVIDGRPAPISDDYRL